MIIFGTKGRSIKMDSGEFHCPNCNTPRIYNKKYVQDWFTLYFFKTYDAIQLHLMAEDSNYIIYSIAGRIFFENDYNGCVIKMEKILPELKTMFSNAYLQDDGTLIWTDVKGRNVKTKSYYLNLKSGADIALECYDQPKEAQIIDGLNLAIDSKEFVNFLTKF